MVVWRGDRARTIRIKSLRALGGGRAETPRMLAVRAAPPPPPPLSIQAEADGLCLTTGPLRFTACAGADLWAAESYGSVLRLQSGAVKLWQPLSAIDEADGRLCVDQRCIRCVHRGNGNRGKTGFCFQGHELVRLTSAAWPWLRPPRTPRHGDLLPPLPLTHSTPHPGPRPNSPALTHPPTPAARRRSTRVRSLRHTRLRACPQAPWRAWCSRLSSSVRDSSGAKAPPSQVAEPRPRCAAQPSPPALPPASPLADASHTLCVLASPRATGHALSAGRGVDGSGSAGGARSVTAAAAPPALLT